MNEKNVKKQETRKPLQLDDKLMGLARVVSGIIKEEEQREYDNRRAQGQNNSFGY